MIEVYDGFQNFVAGFGNPDRSKAMYNQYGAPIYNRTQIDNMYRTSWSGRRVIDIQAKDMTREWRSWDEEPDEMEKAERSFDLQNLIKDAIIAGKKYGGAAIYLGLKGIPEEQLELPLDYDTVKQGDLEYLTPFDRDDLTVIDYEMDPLSPRYRQGKIYSINRGDGARLRIHWTRFAWFEGDAVSPRQRELNEGWADPVFTSMEPLIKNADVAIGSLSELLLEAKVDIFKIDNLGAHFEDSDSEARLRKRMLLTNQMKSTLQAVILDSEEDYVTKTVQMSGVVEVSTTTLEALGAAADIPLTRFLGRSPSGLASTGESDMRNYYDGLGGRQNTELAFSMRPVDEVLVRHVLGKNLDEVKYNWKPLWQSTEKEKAETSKLKAETTQLYMSTGLFEQEFMQHLVLGQLREDGYYPSIELAIDEMGGQDDNVFAEEVEEDDTENPNAADPAKSGARASGEKGSKEAEQD